MIIYLFIALMTYSSLVCSMEKTEPLSSQTVRRLQSLPIEIKFEISNQLPPQYVIDQPKAAKIITSPNNEHSITNQMEHNFFKAMIGGRNLIIKNKCGERSIRHNVPFSQSERQKYKQWLPTFINNQGFFLLNGNVFFINQLGYLMKMTRLFWEFTDIHPYNPIFIALEKPNSITSWASKFSEQIVAKAHIMTMNTLESHTIPLDTKNALFTPDNPNILMIQNEKDEWSPFYLTADYKKTPLDSYTKTHFVHKTKLDEKKLDDLGLAGATHAWLKDPNRSADEGKNLLTMFMKTPLQKRDNESDADFKKRKNTHRFKLIWQSTPDKNYKQNMFNDLNQEVNKLSH